MSDDAQSPQSDDPLGHPNDGAQPTHSAGLRFLQNSFSWLASNVISRAVSALLFILLTQRVPLAETGAYTLGITFTALLMPLLGWGLEHLFIRDVSPNLALVSSYLTRYLAFRLFCGFVAYFFLILIVQFVGYSSATSVILLLMGLMLFSEGINELFQAVFVTLEETHFMLFVVGPLNVVRAMVGLLVLWGGGGAFGLGMVVVGTSFVKMIALGTILARKEYLPRLGYRPWRPKWRLKLAHLVPELTVTIPFVLIDIFWAIEYQSGQVILSIYEGEAAAGLYGAAFAVLAILMLVGQAYMMTIFPVLSRLYQNARESFDFVYEKSIVYMLTIGLSIAVIMTFLGETLLTMVFSDAFAESATMLVPLVWTLPFFFVHVPVSRVMILEDKQRRLAFNIGLAALLNVGLSVLLINWLGAVGASWARLASYSFFFAINYQYVNQSVYNKSLAPLARKPALASAALAAALIALNGTTILASLSFGLSVWIAMLAILRVVTLTDLKAFRAALNVA